MSNKAAKILARLRRSHDNCTRHELEVIYKAHCFRIRIGSKHPMAINTKYKELRGILPNHPKSFAKGYVTCAIDLIDKFLQREEHEKDQKR
jgi:hypothetical protein